MLRGKKCCIGWYCCEQNWTLFFVQPKWNNIDSKTNLEIKCPTKSVTGLTESGKYDLISNNGQLILKPKGRNGYYTQVQIAMYCTGAKVCKFYVWCSDPEERMCIDVPYDEVFLNEIISNARKFSFNICLWELLMTTLLKGWNYVKNTMNYAIAFDICLI